MGWCRLWIAPDKFSRLSVRDQIAVRQMNDDADRLDPLSPSRTYEGDSDEAVEARESRHV